MRLVIEAVTLGTAVDLFITNPFMMVHPMHLHGTLFCVLGTGNGPIYGTGGKLNYALLSTHNPPKCDTQAVPQALGIGWLEWVVASSCASAGYGRHGGNAGLGGPVSSPSITAAMGGAAFSSTGGWAALRFRADNPGNLLAHITLYAPET